ncbi:unnamed protein product [Dracunculus medinensis]|uniref:Neuropeptide F n=1 Tax=Dracunculus medinensis TaxID=318479 RepID=A0A0N4U1E8_DRAME|nr:unnamed protein product [Dracunculus medinensis]
MFAIVLSLLAFMIATHGASLSQNSDLDDAASRFLARYLTQLYSDPDGQNMPIIDEARLKKNGLGLRPLRFG